MANLSVVILLLFCWMSTPSATGLKVLGPRGRVTVEVRQDILLPCFLVRNTSAENMTVTWRQNSTGRLVHLYKDGRDVSDQQHPDYKGRTTLSKDDLYTGNASLTLANVQTSDDGDYTCGVQFGNCSEQVLVVVKVIAKVSVQDTADPVTATVGEDVNLPCHLSPNTTATDVTITWLLKRTGEPVHLYKDDCDQGGLGAYRGRTALLRAEVRRGNASLRLTSVKLSDQAEYVCSIEDGHYWRGNTTVQLQVRPHMLSIIHRVTVEVRQDILLPCFLVPKTSAENRTVTWRQNNTGRLVHLYKDGRDVSDQQHPDYKGRTTLSKDGLNTGNASITLANVQMSDDGDYTCQIQDGPWRTQLTLHVKVNAYVAGKLTDTAHSWKAGFGIMFVLALALATALAVLLTRVRRRLYDKYVFKQNSETQEPCLVKDERDTSNKSFSPFKDVDVIRQFGVDITLDPATAHPQLSLSDDGKRVVKAELTLDTSPTKERFSTELCVVAREGITSGAHYYEVVVQGSREWIVGLISGHTDRSGPLDDQTAADLYLVLQVRDGTCYSSERGSTVIQLREDIQRVGVFVDYEKGFVSFYDVEDGCFAHLYSFTRYYFNQTLFPIFSPGRGEEEASVPLVILPMQDVRPFLTYELKSEN